MRSTSSGLLLATFLCSVLAADLPINFQTCKRSDPKFNDCLKTAIEDSFSKIAKGSAALSLPALEHLEIPSATIGEGKGAVNVVQKYKNLKIENLVETKVQKVETTITPTTLAVSVDVFSPEYLLKADYDFNGRILLLPISGNGKCTLGLNDCKVTLKFSGETTEKNGKTYLKITEFKVGIYPGKAVFNFENLFNGDERLGNEMNKVLNENWKEVFEDVRSGYEELLATVFQNHANIIFSKIPYSDLIPE